MTCITSINIIPNNNEVVLNTVNNLITVTDNNCCTTVTVVQPTTETIQILTGPQGIQGIQGPQGPQGPQGSLPTSGSWNFSGSIAITGSLTVTNGITGSLYGSSSYSENSLSSSYAVTASHVDNLLLNDLTDVVITSVTSSQALVFNGTEWVNQNVATSSEGTLGIIFDGFGGTIIASQQYPFLVVPFNCIINNWSIVADTTGDIEIDIWRANNAVPLVANSIVNSNYITLVAQQINTGLLTGWTSVNLVAGDIINFDVRSATTITKATVTLKITK